MDFIFNDIKNNTERGLNSIDVKISDSNKVLHDFREKAKGLYEIALIDSHVYTVVEDKTSVTRILFIYELLDKEP